MATNEIGTVSIGIEADTRAFRQQMQQIGTQGGNDLNRTLTRGLQAGMIIASIKLIGDAITGITKSAMQFEAATQQVDRIFGTNSQTVKNWARNNAKSFNMSKSNFIPFIQKCQFDSHAVRTNSIIRPMAQFDRALLALYPINT